MKKKTKTKQNKKETKGRNKNEQRQKEGTRNKAQIFFLFIFLLFIRNFQLWRKKFGTAPPYILRISDKYKQQTIVPRKKKERQKENEWKEREKTKQASSFGKLRLEWSACESGHIKES